MRLGDLRTCMVRAAPARNTPVQGPGYPSGPSSFRIARKAASAAVVALLHLAVREHTRIELVKRSSTLTTCNSMITQRPGRVCVRSCTLAPILDGKDARADPGNPNWTPLEILG